LGGSELLLLRSELVDRIKHPSKLGDRLGEPDGCDLSLLVLFEGWREDLERLHSSALEGLGGSWEMVVVDNPGDDDASEGISKLERVVHVPLRDRLGFGAARNLAMRLATGRLVAVVDTSVEITGDLGARLDRALADERVGLVGRWGVVTSNGFDFEESEGPDVDGIEAYLMCLRRSDVENVGFFDPKFRFYRNADLDYSFKVRDAGLLTVVDPGLPVTRHAHRVWESTPPGEREQLSRKNFARFRQHWEDRPDLFLVDH
jgi:GT2 family glycosyltransferase